MILITLLIIPIHSTKCEHAGWKKIYIFFLSQNAYSWIKDIVLFLLNLTRGVYPGDKVLRRVFLLVKAVANVALALGPVSFRGRN